MTCLPATHRGSGAGQGVRGAGMAMYLPLKGPDVVHLQRTVDAHRMQG